MEKQYLIDIMLLDDGMYRAVLLPATVVGGGVGGAACPQIPSIHPEVLNERLGRVLGLTQKQLDKIKDSIKADSDRETEIPVSATLEQLAQLGFLGLEQRSA